VPRITGPDIATHVAHQRDAVVASAVRLFAERGFDAVTLGDIAEDVGLARTSLYRYFPDKDHILLAWLRREIDALAEQSVAIASGDAPAGTRLKQWLHLQLSYVREPEHELFSKIASSLGTLSPAVQQAIGVSHRELYATMESIVADALKNARSRRDPRLVAALVLGLFQAAVGEVGRGADISTVERELHRAALAVVNAR
jgi:AcrR family transcriptional regulator